MTADHTALRKPKCGWPKPFLPRTGAAVVHCMNCHGRLRFNVAMERWEHER